MKRVSSLLFLFIIFWISCGVKGSPKIPPSKIPEAVKNIKIKQQGETLLIYWKYNPMYEDKRSIKEPFFFRIEENDVEIHPQIKNYKNIYWFRKKLSSFDQEFCYKIEVITKRGYTAKSEYFCYLPSKNFPYIDTKIKTVLKNNGILLTWDKNYEHIFIYRGFDENLILPIPYAHIINEITFLDKNVKLNKKYCYYITISVDNIESNPSKVSCMIFRDIFPPEPVRNPDIIKHKGKLFIIWTESPSEDVVGYLIEKNGKILNKKPIYTYFFVLDKYKRGDIIVIYAVDKAGNKSPPVYLRVE